ncbi:hypothetical protein BU24DRAFT_459277 [Aaosphaeria arxii CBS 175.79]|uniref:Uncharacterized protein n=1 Tax=Aaosphaeria arxii CBS 175.79 TaxID=1450172 RepID=A0A6A5Y252_9PLEO|nr:uncharacterized protein BU24DRAFT_459277 [Aaosphaeria arxii CBS 175.79]KAF2019625.1 hypothetical protein BU24DRAFT_459277 [Aaosphaeria arxii CBS 175.79]
MKGKWAFIAIAALNILVTHVAGRPHDQKDVGKPESQPTATIATIGNVSNANVNYYDLDHNNGIPEAEKTHNALQPRASPKSFNPCGADNFISNPYKSWSAQPNIRAYGWVYDDLNHLHDTEWVTRANTPAYLRALNSGIRFHTEHDLEWQLVGSFFNWVDDELSHKSWQHPDPSVGGTVGFCDYFVLQWERDAIILNGRYHTARTPFQLIADHYPHTHAFSDEMVGLYASMNNMKSRVFAAVPAQIYDGDDINRWIATNKREALRRARQAIGLARYLQETSDIFATQALRIRGIIDEIDRDLGNHRKLGTWRPWQYQGLSTLFDEYMDTVWRGSSEALSQFTRDVYRNLKARSCSSEKRREYLLTNAQNELLFCRAVAALWTQYSHFHGTQPRPW